MSSFVMKSQIDEAFIEKKIRTYKDLNRQFALIGVSGETWKDAYGLILGDFIKVSEELLKEQKTVSYCDCDDRSIASMIMCKDF